MTPVGSLKPLLNKIRVPKKSNKNTESQTVLELRNALAWMDLVLTSLKEGVCVVDKHGNINYVNDSIVNLVELDRITLLGKKITEVFPLTSVEGKKPLKLSKDWANKNAKILNKTLKLNTGKAEHIVEIASKHIESLNQTVIIFRNITAQQQLDKKIQESNQRFQAVFEGSADAIMLLDKKGFFDCNKATLKLFGLTKKDQFVGIHPSKISPPKQPNGHTFPADVLLARMQIDNRTALQATVRDITVQKQAEKKLKDQIEATEK